MMEIGRTDTVTTAALMLCIGVRMEERNQDKCGHLGKSIDIQNVIAAYAESQIVSRKSFCTLLDTYFFTLLGDTFLNFIRARSSPKDRVTLLVFKKTCVGRNYSSSDIFVTYPQIRHFLPTY